VRNISTLP